MIVFPNCKINLGLNIVARRPDGYHDIETVMVPVGWCDSLEIVPAEGTESTLTVLGRRVDCPQEKNLVMKAFRVMEREYSLPPVHMYLIKNIPDGAGLGGGSADASFAVRCLNDLFSVGLGEERMSDIVAGIGADCPFFIYNRPMIATGTGTILKPIDVDLGGKGILVVKATGTAVSTAEAYASVVPRKPDYDLEEVLRTRAVNEWQHTVKNDFEAGIFQKQPLVGDIKRIMIEAGAEYAAMSGSGSSVFGIFKDDKVADNVRRMFEGYDVFVGTLE